MRNVSQSSLQQVSLSQLSWVTQVGQVMPANLQKLSLRELRVVTKVS